MGKVADFFLGKVLGLDKALEDGVKSGLQSLDFPGQMQDAWNGGYNLGLEAARLLLESENNHSKEYILKCLKELKKESTYI